MIALLLAAALALGQTAHGAGKGRPDALSALEQNPSASATESVGRMYRRTKDPYARLWLVEALYSRVQQYRDEKALELLVAASKDKNADVRRKALNSLEAVRYLSPERRKPWTDRIEGIARAAQKDASLGVSSAGRDLQQAAHGWSEAEAEPRPSPGRSEGGFSRWFADAMPQVFVWVVSLQLIGYLWHRMGMGILSRMGASGAAVIEAIAVFDKRPRLLAFPLVTGLLLLPTFGLTIAAALITAAMPSGDPIGWLRVALFVLAIYTVSGLSCFLPALLMIGHLCSGKGPTLRRFVGLVGLAEISLLLWPIEPLLRRLPRRRRDGGALSWIGRTGAPFAALLAGRTMIEEGLRWPAALRRSAKRFASADLEPGSELWGRGPFHPAFVVWCLASPILFSLTVLPAIWLGFKPTELFGFWFLSNVQFAVGFGWWAGALLSVSAFGQLMILGAIRGASIQEARS